MREEILKIAEKQMKDGGYETLNFGAIAKELSTTRANLHYHFKNKETLALEAIKSYSDEHFEELKRISTETKGDFFGFVKAIEQHFWDDSLHCGSCGTCACSQVIRESNPPESLRGVAKMHFFDVQNLMFAKIKEAVDAGQLPKHVNQKLIGTQFGAMMMGFMTMAQVFSSVEEARENLSGVVDGWLEMIKNM